MRKRAPGRTSAKLAIVAMVVAVAAPQGFGTADAASAQAKFPHPKHDRISTEGRAPSSQLMADRQVTVMLELSLQPAALRFRAALGKGIAAARSASKSQTAVVERQSATVASQARGLQSTKVLYRVSRLYSGVAVQTTTRQLAALRALPGVKAVHVMTAKTVSNANSVPLINAPAQWQTGSAGTGAGVTVGIIDTGIDYTHKNFGGPGTVGAYTTAKAADTAAPTYPHPAKVAGGYDFAGDAYDPANGVEPTPDTNPLDCEGHGSHVAGTTAGYGVTQAGATYAGPWDASTDFNAFKLNEATGEVGIGPGVAPGATLYALKVFGCEGSTDLVTEALDWAADPNGDGDISDHLDVVNMSLGSDFSSADDPDAVASNNASLAGVTVVASAGNGGDITDIGGAPGNATRVISVAATDDGYGIFDGLRVDSGSAVQPKQLKVAERSAAYDWATGGGLTTPTEVVTLGNWGSPPGVGNNTDGCSPLSAADAAKVNGKVALLFWTDTDANRACGSAGRSARVRAAGAVGAVLANDQENFAAGITGDTVIPVMIVVKSAGIALEASVENNQHPTVELRYDDRNSTTLVTTEDAPASFTSRGRRASGGLKPDVAAPGISTFSTAIGTGFEGVSENGTSMAAPHVAGVAALVKAAHHGWTPEEIKAAIMGTARTDLSNLSPYGPSRVGSGRVDAAAAAGTDLLAYVTTDPGAVSVGFGTVRAVTNTTVSKTVHIVNKSGSSRTVDVDYDAIHAVPGATVSVTPTSLSLDPGDGGDVVVRLSLVPDDLRQSPDPTMPTDFSGIPTDLVTEITGRVVVSEGPTAKLHIPVEATPRPASAMTQTSGNFPVGATVAANVALTGTSVTSGLSQPDGYASGVTALELQGVDERLPDCGGGYAGVCVPFPSARAGDMRYTAAGSTVPADVTDGFDPYDPLDSASYLYFGITAWDKWSTPASFSEYDVWIDTNNDHKPDFVTYNTRLGVSDVMVAETDVLDASGTPVAVAENGIQFLNDLPTAAIDSAKYDNESLVLPVFVPTLGLTSTKHRINWWVNSGSIETGYIDSDASAAVPHSFDVAKPALQVTDSPPAYVQSPYTFFQDDPSAPLRVTKTTSAYVADKAQGLWLFHHLNTDGNRAQILRIRQVQTFTVPAAAKVSHKAINGRFVLGSSPSTSGLPVSVVSTTPATCLLSAGYVYPRGAGVCSLTFSQAGNADYVPASVIAKFAVIGATKVLFSSSDSNAPRSQRVTLVAAARVLLPSAQPLTGSMRFYDGTRLMGTVAITPPTSGIPGTAQFRLPVLTVGTHTLKAVFVPSTPWYTGSTSGIIHQVVT